MLRPVFVDCKRKNELLVDKNDSDKYLHILDITYEINNLESFDSNNLGKIENNPSNPIGDNYTHCHVFMNFVSDESEEVQTDTFAGFKEHIVDKIFKLYTSTYHTMRQFGVMGYLGIKNIETIYSCAWFEKDGKLYNVVLSTKSGERIAEFSEKNTRKINIYDSVLKL